MSKKSAAQKHVEERIVELTTRGGNRAGSGYFQALLEMQRVRDSMQRAGEWVGEEQVA